MKSEQVAAYLQEHPEFFEEYADMLANIYLPHPHGGRAIPISERQILSLREKNRALESKLKELIEFGEENDAIGEKMHRLTLALVAARDAESVIQLLYFHLREDFAVPHTAIRLWPQWDHPQTPISRAVSMASRDFAASLSAPYCCAKAMVDLPPTGSASRRRSASYAYVALRGQRGRRPAGDGERGSAALLSGRWARSI